MQYLKFSNRIAFDAWLASMDTIKGFDDSGGTETYTLAHPGTDGAFYAPVREADINLIEQTWEAVHDDWPKPIEEDTP